MEAFTTKGHWWLPGNRPDNATDGIFTFDPLGQSKLELFGSFSAVTRTEPIILGVGDKGQAITLVHCLNLGGKPSFSDYLWEHTIFSPELILQNQHFERQEEITFERIGIKFYGLEEWASTGKSWGSISADELFEPRSNEDTVTVGLDDFKVSFWRGHLRSGDQWNSVSVRRDAAIELVPNGPWGIDDTYAKIFQIRVFLSLAMRTATWPVAINASNSASSPRGFSLHFNPRTNLREATGLHSHSMYFTLESQHTAIERILRNWFANCNKLDQVLYLYNRDISSKMALDEQFLIYAKAVEAYHRKVHDKTYVDTAKYDELIIVLKKKIKACIPSNENKELRRRIYESLILANSPSLHDRLADLQERHQDHFRQLVEDFDAFADAVVSTRNYFTHYFDPDQTKVRRDGDSLFYMNTRLRYILEICLLNELGFGDSEIQEMVTRHFTSLNLPPIPEWFASPSQA